ncbi:uncharacterized protein LOC119083426 [Bradysia coprophila]|uniref:uncharacterized protein LOC119083418 n=1 Tax=Bradysia coprophila TaxID=38358 RepID=UPI00187DBBBD|nr:uncharacterized protein LOC119083418 [Bradysia coprophila]XP_037049045.1 uncharacterized protein LOC119083425 [Bradysia coprophila]XP_037049046.1 uncharacterized protein LOC119083426 [Bradysia coprophila]
MKFALLIFAAGLALVEPHGYVHTPLSRTSIFRRPNEFPGAQQPFWWDDTGVWCGNVQQNQQYSTCGRCGDAPGNTHAQQGGRYDKGIITGTYNAGQVINAIVEFTANHRGGFMFELCPQVSENNNCFQRLRINSADRGVRDNNWACSGGDHQNGQMRVAIQLPAGVRCTRCTLRWTYRTSYPPAPDACWNPNNAQTFRNCVDIRIN